MIPDRKKYNISLFAIGVILFLVLLVAFILLVKYSPESKKESSSVSHSTQEVKRSVDSIPEKKEDLHLKTNVLSETQDLPSPPEITPAEKEVVLADLNRAACTYEASSLPKIEPYLYSKDKELREAALNDIVILGDAAGAPLLRKAAEQSQDPNEAAELMNKANYLELPSGSLLKAK